MSAKGKAAGATTSATASKTHKQQSNVIAIRAMVTEAMSGFYVDRGIGVDTLLMAALLVIYAGWMVLA